MPSLEEAANAFASDLVAMNIPAVMAAFTPEGMMKMMALQGSILARLSQAQASGQTVTLPPAGQMPAQPPATKFEIAIEEGDGEDRPVRMTFSGPSGTGVFLTTWREVEGAWKVNDVSLVDLLPKESPQST